jgi:hypothetical protein
MVVTRLKITGAGAGHEITGAGAGHEITGAGAGHATGAGAGHGTWQHGPNLLNTFRLYRCLADALESNPAIVMMSGASAIKMEYLALLVIVFLH